MTSHTQAKPHTTSDGPTTASTATDSGIVNTRLPYDPVVEALRILARRGQQVLEEEAAARAAAEGGAG